MTIINIDVTHQQRLRCLARLFKYSKNGTIVQYKDDKEIKSYKFNNCCVIKMTFSADRAKLDMIYDGSNLSGEWPTAAIGEKTDDDKKILNKMLEKEGGDSSKKIWTVTEFNSYGFYLEGKFGIDGSIAYVIRHGFGMHNYAKDLQGKKLKPIDARLHTVGKAGAYVAGTKIKYNIGDVTKHQYRYYGSFLRRTWETLINCSMGTTGQNDVKKIAIVPCSHEMMSGNCDGGMEINVGAINAENRSETTGKVGDISKLNQNNYYYDNSNGDISAKPNQNLVHIDYRYYRAFYEHKNRCRDTNMIIQLSNIIKDHDAVNNIQASVKRKSKRKYMLIKG
jgi:hypothetical protein